MKQKIEKEENKKIKKAAKEMNECKEIWNEIKDWDVTLELTPHQTPS